MDIFDAIRHDPENVPDMILEDGFDDLEAEDRLGNSPLHIAVEQAKVLLEVADGIHMMPLGDIETGVGILREAGVVSK